MDVFEPQEVLAQVIDRCAKQREVIVSGTEEDRNRQIGDAVWTLTRAALMLARARDDDDVAPHAFIWRCFDAVLSIVPPGEGLCFEGELPMHRPFFLDPVEDDRTEWVIGYAVHEMTDTATTRKRTRWHGASGERSSPRSTRRATATSFLSVLGRSLRFGLGRTDPKKV